MKMRFLFIICLFFVALSAKAQMYVGGTFNFTHDDNADATEFTLAPEFGYNFNDRFAVAAELGFTHGDVKDVDVNAFFLAPYVRWTFFEKGMLRLFLDGGFGFSTAKVEDFDRENGFEVGVKPGIALELTKNFAFVTKYGFLGYRDDYKLNNSVSGLSLSTEDLSIGFEFSF